MMTNDEIRAEVGVLVDALNQIKALEDASASRNMTEGERKAMEEQKTRIIVVGMKCATNIMINVNTISYALEKIAKSLAEPDDVANLFKA